MNLSEILWTLGSCIFLALGIIHTYLTFWTRAFQSKNKEVMEIMQKNSMKLTNETSVWQAWIGFHASHALGVILYGLLNLYAVSQSLNYLQEDYFLLLTDFSVLTYYAYLSKRYWFHKPFYGVLCTFILFITSLCLKLYA